MASRCTTAADVVAVVLAVAVDVFVLVVRVQHGGVVDLVVVGVVAAVVAVDVDVDVVVRTVEMG